MYLTEINSILKTYKIPYQNNFITMHPQLVNEITKLKLIKSESFLCELKKEISDHKYDLIHNIIHKNTINKN